METEIRAVPPEETNPSASLSLPIPRTAAWRVVYGLFVTVLPAFSFWATNLLKPEWQDGQVRSYVTLLLFPEASLLFFPLLAYPLVCYLLLLWAPERFARSFLVRFGIYTGVLLAFQYSIAMLFLVETGVLLLVLVWISPILCALTYRWAAARWTPGRVNRVLFILVPVILLTATLLTQGNTLLLILITMVAGAPFWCLLISARSALWLFRHVEIGLTLPRNLGIAAWIAGYLAAWRFDILKMYELYAALPTEPPGCYIATAAARGHSKVVGAWTVRCADGTSLRVNRQLQTLKCAELVLMAVQPRFHRALRHMYDVVGTYLALRIQHPLLADAAYLLLKPCEWLAGGVLTFIIPEIDSISKNMYSN